MTHKFVKRLKPERVWTNAGVQALAKYASEGNVDQVRKLVADGVDPNARGESGVSPLIWAMAFRSEDGMVALLDNGADPYLAMEGGVTPIHMSAMADDQGKLLRVFIDRKVNVDIRNSTNQRTPVFDAIFAKRDAQVRDLLKAGADPNAKDAEGSTPLHEASLVNNWTAVMDLLRSGSDPRAIDAGGATFQSYFFMTDEAVLSDEAREGRRLVTTWLRHHGVSLETDRE